MIIFREEHFGGVLFDTDTLRYSLIEGRPATKPDRILLAQELPSRRDILSAPVRIYFEITRRCNLSCTHCFVSSSPRAPEGMPTSRAIALLDHMHDMNVIELRITGGEPTTRDDWFQLLSHAQALGFIVSLNTNGVYAEGQRTIDQLLALNLAQVTISIDGIEGGHDQIRGPGTFAASMSSLRKLYAGGACVRVNTVLTRDNISRFRRFFVVARLLCQRSIFST